MEEVVGAVLAAYGIAACTIDGLTGVWTAERRKIGSIGGHVSRGVTTHGFAVNVNNDLQPFEWVVPCGLEGVRMTSLCRELGSEVDMTGYMDGVAERFGVIYGRDPVPTDAHALGELLGEPASVR